MNDHREQPAGKETLADSLLALDSQMPSSSAEAREIAKKALRRDRRWVRILTWMTIGFFLLTVLGICFFVYLYYIKIVPAMRMYERDDYLLRQQLDKQEPQPAKPDLPVMTARMTVGLGWGLFTIQAITVWGFSALFAIMLAAAFCTVLLIMTSRRATLRQIQASLLVLSEQFDTLQHSLQGSHSPGGGQAAQGPGA